MQTTPWIVRHSGGTGVSRARRSGFTAGTDAKPNPRIGPGGPLLPDRGGSVMKLIAAVVKPFKLEEVRTALSELGVSGITVSEVKGFGRQKGHVEHYRGAEYSVEFLPKAKLEVALDDSLLEQAIEVIVKAARTGKIGDGKIFVYDLEQVIRIRTGESGPDAL
jgi:nitrogen regulatory protein P-II 2